MHSTRFPLSRFQMVVAVLLAIVSLISAEASPKNPVPMYPTWEFGGCWSDSDPTVRDLNTEVTVPGGLANASVENCIGECKSMNLTSAGMEGQACWCGDQFTAGSAAMTGAQQIDIDSCNTPCTGDHSEYCGGSGALLLYFDSAA
ncbi:hypothetical protein EI94DRAFT_1742462 [Lactarius quietus]|nr:hypothetical protein EI94DRAFT_1742462 [Lactarius quietus]